MNVGPLSAGMPIITCRRLLTMAQIEYIRSKWSETMATGAPMILDGDMRIQYIPMPRTCAYCGRVIPPAVSECVGCGHPYEPVPPIE